MTNVQQFLPGTKVRMKKNPARAGTVAASDPQILGPKIRQKVNWDNGTSEFVNIALLEEAGVKELTLSELMLRGAYGTKDDLRSNLTQYRLSGVLDNIIYSLNLTNTEFLPYQFIPLITFFKAMKNRLLIADEVGLGKTIEAGLIWTELQMRDNAMRLLVICPAALCEKWQHELSSRFSVKADIVSSSELLENIRKISTGETRSGAFICSLQGIRPPKGWKRKEESRNKSAAELARALLEIDDSSIFNMLIVDEAHHIRNPQTSQYTAVDLLKKTAENILLLSATPIQTSSSNLFSLLNILDRDSYPYESYLNHIIESNKPLIELIARLEKGRLSLRGFLSSFYEIKNLRASQGLDTEAFSNFLKANHLDEKTFSDPAVRIRLIRRLNDLNPLNQIMVRSLKRNVKKNRVLRQPVTVSVEMSKSEESYYQTVTEQIRFYCQEHDTNGGFWEAIAQQQMTSCMPASLEYWSQEAAEESPVETQELDEDENADEAQPLLTNLRKAATDFPFKKDLISHDSKLHRLLAVIKEYQRDNPGEKIILFSFFKRTLTYLEANLIKEGISCILISGDYSRQERNERIKKFKEENYTVLLSSEVAAEGIDLQFVSCLINYDLPWNPARIEQRIGRIDRIGQRSSKILIFNFIYENTIEERIYERLLKRFDVFKKALGVAEEILGDSLKKLSRDLFNRNLTPDQELEKIDQTALAIENNKAIKDEADGVSLVYNLMQKQVENAQEMERFILDEDLLDYVHDYCRREKGGSKLYEAEDGLYKLDLSVDARIEMGEYFAEHSGELHPTEILSNPDLLIRFRNKQDIERRGIERITQNHPLIKFISYWNRKNKNQSKRLSAISYPPSSVEREKLKEVGSGTYVYRVDYWKYSGIKRLRGQLAYSVLEAETGAFIKPEQAENLVNLASRNGQTLIKDMRVTPSKVIELDDTNEEHLNSCFSDYVDEMKTQAENEAKFSQQMYSSKLEELEKEYTKRMDDFRWEELLNKTGAKGRRVSFENKYKRRKENITERIEAIARKLAQQEFSETLVSAGVIELEI